MGFNIMDLMNGATRAAVEGVDNYEAITLNLDEIKVTKHNRYSMGKIILFPTHPDYCKRCIYSRSNGTCASEKYNENQYKVNCVWHYCKYRKEKAEYET